MNRKKVKKITKPNVKKTLTLKDRTEKKIITSLTFKR
jgi:hypothetical protein